MQDKLVNRNLELAEYSTFQDYHLSGTMLYSLIPIPATRSADSGELHLCSFINISKLFRNNM